MSYLTAREAAEALGVSKQTVLRWWKRGLLRGEQVGTPQSPVRIDAKSVVELKEKARKGGA